MRISTKGRYALRLMLDLALYGNGLHFAAGHIRKTECVRKYLEQIVVILARAGFVKSVRGPQGGYRLARPPKDYTAGEILRLIEGSLAPVPCLEDDTNSCPRSAECATVVLWSRLNQAISGVVDGMTLEDLAVIQRSKVDEAKDGM
ncbi:MAG: RrF2 family transcriptional regulator [Bianqueaceae bacterium]